MYRAMASGDSPDLGSIMNEEETLAGIRALMAVQIKKTRKAVSRLRWGARRFPLFAILPGLGAAGVAIAPNAPCVATIQPSPN